MSNLGQLLQLTRPLIVMDTETTGLNVKVDRIVSLSFRVHRPDGTVQAYKTLINPTVLIGEVVSKIHGITDETIRIGCARCWAPLESHPHGTCPTWKPVPKFADIAENLFRGFTDADFGGYNVQFDLDILCAELSRCKLELDRTAVALVDAKRLWQLLEPRTLTDAVQHFLGRQLEGAHNATVDVEATEAVLVAQLEKHPRSTSLPRDVKELHQLSFPKKPKQAGWIDEEGKFAFINEEPCVNFGKKCPGASMRSTIALSYMRWMLDQKFNAEVRLICNKALAGEFPSPD